MLCAEFWGEPRQILGPTGKRFERIMRKYCPKTSKDAVQVFINDQYYKKILVKAQNIGKDWKSNKLLVGVGIPDSKGNYKDWKYDEAARAELQLAKKAKMHTVDEYDIDRGQNSDNSGSTERSSSGAVENRFTDFEIACRLFARGASDGDMVRGMEILLASFKGKGAA